MTVVGTPSLEVEAIAHVRALGIEAGTSLPNPVPPPAFARITRTGGSGRQNPRQTLVTLLVEVFAADEDTAWTWAQRTHAALSLRGQRMAGLWVYEAQLAEPANFPDRTASLARFQFIGTFRVPLIEIEEAP